MTDKVITNLEQVTPAWLTAVLRQSGAVTEGSVESFELNTGQGNWSKSGSFKVTYSKDAKGSLPKKLFLKMVETDWGEDEWFTDSEVSFYTRDYIDVTSAPLLRCYSGAYSQEDKRYHLLLDDVSDTHIEAADKEPTLEYGLALAEGLATLHAHWWGAERLAAAGASMHSADHIRRFVDIAAPGVDHILEKYSHELQPHWGEDLREIFTRHPQTLIDRTSDMNGFTLIHGDVGAGNILVPRHGDRPIYIIDRQPFNWSLTTWLGVYDLAYAIVLDWDVEIRRQYETPILERYLEHLIKNEVQNYTWEQLYNDYRSCAVMGTYIATEYCRGGINERSLHVWLPMLQRALTACDDLDCYNLWRK